MTFNFAHINWFITIGCMQIIINRRLVFFYCICNQIMCEAGYSYLWTIRSSFYNILRVDHRFLCILKPSVHPSLLLFHLQVTDIFLYQGQKPS